LADWLSLSFLHGVARRKGVLLGTPGRVRKQIAADKHSMCALTKDELRVHVADTNIEHSAIKRFD